MTHIPWNPAQAKVATKAAAFDRSTLTRLGLLGALGGGAAYGASQLGDMIPGIGGDGLESLQLAAEQAGGPADFQDAISGPRAADLDSDALGRLSEQAGGPSHYLDAQDSPQVDAWGSGRLDETPGPAPTISAATQAPFVRWGTQGAGGPSEYLQGMGSGRAGDIESEYLQSAAERAGGPSELQAAAEGGREAELGAEFRAEMLRHPPGELHPPETQEYLRSHAVPPLESLVGWPR